MVLTEKQRSDLHDAILEYLCSDSELAQAAEAFAQSVGLERENVKVGSIPMLEKKWTSVVRLQRKVLDLENKVKDMENERKFVGAVTNGGGAGMSSSLKTGESFLLKTTSTQRLRGHRAPVTCVVFHPRFNLLVSTSEDATIKVWDFETGEFERTLKGHTNTVQDACFNEDGTLLATCSSDMSIKLWDFSPSSSYDCTKTMMGHDHSVSGVAFLSGGTQLVSCSRDKTLKLWDTSSGFCLRTLTGHDDWVRRVTVHRPTNAVATCSSDHSVIVWNLNNSNTGTDGSVLATLRGHTHVVECVAFSSAAADKALGSSASQIGDGDGTVNMALKGKRQGGQHIVSGSRDRTIRVWQVQSSVCLFVLQGHENWVRALSFQPNGKYLLSGSEDKTIKMWDLQQQKPIRTITSAHGHFITTLAVHPTLAVVASASVDQEIAVWGAAPTGFTAAVPTSES